MNAAPWSRSWYAWCALIFLVVLPVSETIALRNLLLLAMTLGWLAVALRHVRDGGAWRRLWQTLPLTWWLWFAFLVLFPLIAHDRASAWSNLGGQWGESLFTWCAAFALALLSLPSGGPGLLALAFAASGPVWVHLALVAVGWLGLLGPLDATVGDLSMGAVVQKLMATVSSVPWPGLQSFPWGFRGVEPMHGNIGYAACVGIVLFVASAYGVLQQGTTRRLVVPIMGIAGCFVSILVANSRGAFLFGALVLVATIVLAVLYGRAGTATQARGLVWPARRVLLGCAAGIVLLAVVGGAARESMAKDPRWGWMFDRVRVGLMTEDPFVVLCNDVPPALEQEIRDKFASRGKEYTDQMIYGLRIQDGGRIMLMRAGFQLALEHPLGVDGSRLTYQRLMEQKCGHPPALHFSHAHQGWIDTALALGWVGVALLLALFVQLLLTGWRLLRVPQARAWALGLVVVSGFWMARGFADSVYREHFLQMQGFVLGYLYLRARSAAKAAGHHPENIPA